MINSSKPKIITIFFLIRLGIATDGAAFCPPITGKSKGSKGHWCQQTCLLCRVVTGEDKVTPLYTKRPDCKSALNRLFFRKRLRLFSPDLRYMCVSHKRWNFRILIPDRNNTLKYFQDNRNSVVLLQRLFERIS